MELGFLGSTGPGPLQGPLKKPAGRGEGLQELRTRDQTNQLVCKLTLAHCDQYTNTIFGGTRADTARATALVPDEDSSWLPLSSYCAAWQGRSLRCVCQSFLEAGDARSTYVHGASRFYTRCLTSSCALLQPMTSGPCHQQSMQMADSLREDWGFDDELLALDHFLFCLPSRPAPLVRGSHAAPLAAKRDDRAFCNAGTISIRYVARNIAMCELAACLGAVGEMSPKGAKEMQAVGNCSHAMRAGLHLSKQQRRRENKTRN